MSFRHLIFDETRDAIMVGRAANLRPVAIELGRVKSGAFVIALHEFGGYSPGVGEAITFCGLPVTFGSATPGITIRCERP